MSQLASITPQGPDSVIVQLKGELDLATVPALEVQLRKALSIAPSLIVDLQDVTFLDAGVIGCLAGARGRAVALGGELVLRGVSPWIRSILRAAQVEETFG